MAGHATGAPAQVARAPAIGHKTLASLYNARHRQVPRRPSARRQGSVGSLLRLCDGLPADEAAPLWQSAQAELARLSI